MRAAEIRPSRAAASAEGGIGFVFRASSGLAILECLNDGGAAALVRIDGSPAESWELGTDAESLGRAVAKIKAALQG